MAIKPIMPSRKGIAAVTRIGSVVLFASLVGVLPRATYAASPFFLPTRPQAVSPELACAAPSLAPFDYDGPSDKPGGGDPYPAIGWLQAQLPQTQDINETARNAACNEGRHVVLVLQVYLRNEAPSGVINEMDANCGLFNKDGYKISDLHFILVFPSLHNGEEGWSVQEIGNFNDPNAMHSDVGTAQPPYMPPGSVVKKCKFFPNY